jgi:hypothetical protein
MSDSKFHTHTNHRQDYYFVYSNFHTFYAADENTKDSGMNASKQYQNTRTQSPFNLFLDQILICYCCPQIFELQHIFKQFVYYFYVLILIYILVTR